MSPEDLVTVLETDEMEAVNIQAMLESEGIATVIIGTAALPNLPFEVRVTAADADRAREAIEAHQAAGPSGALEAEEETEEPS